MRRVERGYRDLSALYNIKQRLYDDSEILCFGAQPRARKRDSHANGTTRVSPAILGTGPILNCNFTHSVMHAQIARTKMDGNATCSPSLPLPTCT